MPPPTRATASTPGKTATTPTPSPSRPTTTTPTPPSSFPSSAIPSAIVSQAIKASGANTATILPNGPSVSRPTRYPRVVSSTPSSSMASAMPTILSRSTSDRISTSLSSPPTTPPPISDGIPSTSPKESLSSTTSRCGLSSPAAAIPTPLSILPIRATPTAPGTSAAALPGNTLRTATSMPRG